MPVQFGVEWLSILRGIRTLLAWLVFKEPISKQRLLGFLVSIIGLLLLTTQGGESMNFSYHQLCFLLGALAWAIFTTATKAWKVEPLHATAIVSVLSLVGYLPYYLLSGKVFHLMTVPGLDILLQAMVQGVLTAIVALWAYGKAIAYLGPSRAGFFPILTPVVGTLLAIPLLNEVPSYMEVIGMTVVCVGFLLGLNLSVKKYLPIFVS
jgi:drug/metabolite transporter (DMT)-like permease